ncbi:hypothetical protein RND81_05G218100 [Saponaria officinalis]
MNGAHLNGRARGSEKAVPGCLGRMANLFDLSSGVPGNRRLTDKPHNDGSLSRSQSDISRMSSIVGDDMEDKAIVSELRRSSSNRKPNGTPVKMLMAQEMSKNSELRQNSPNVVAKLMGLDAFPKQQHNIATQRTHSKFYTRKCHSEIPVGNWQDEGGFFPEKVDDEIHTHPVQNEFKDIHEILQQSQRTNRPREKSPQRGRSSENVHEKRLCLIRQKFMEAKRLATDEKLRQTKEFQDALDFLSSNGDLFLKVLQEPNSLFTPHLCGGQSVPPSPETKKITILRPSKMMVDDVSIAPARKDEKQVKKQFQANQVNLRDNHSNGFSPTISTWKADDSPAQPTRIVVLKPTFGKVNGAGISVTSTPSSPRAPRNEIFFAEAEDKEAREVAKEITQQMRENLAVPRRDETLLSSVFSNGYTGDESSFEKSVNGCADRDLSDSEVISPTSRLSWDYVNRFGSPHSISSFSRASCSPESSVCREAKKRLSERWAMMGNGSNEEPRQFHRSSSTLGEMLALSEIKKSEICEEDSDSKDEDPRASTTSLLNKSIGAGDGIEDSPRNLLRSKSVPISSTAYREGVNVEVSNPVVAEKLGKAKVRKTSFTGKVTSLFFSKNKKSEKAKSGKLQSNDESQLAAVASSALPAPPERTSNDHSEVVLSPSELRGATFSVDMNDERLGQGFDQGALYVSQPCTRGIPLGNPDQPSPISVLEQSFEEVEATKQPALSLSKFNLIDKSPPIGTISRTMSWDENCTETASTYPLDSPFMSTGVEIDEGGWFYLVQSLLTMAGLDNEGQVGPNLSRWHTPDSPLDPLLKEKYIDLSAKDTLHEARRRQSRSSRKLVFDCVNAALLDITGFGTPAHQRSTSCVGTRSRFSESGPTSLADRVWDRMKEWFSSEVKYSLVDDSGDSNSLIEMLMMKDVAGTGWTDEISFEIDDIGKEIEGKLLEELVEESVVALTGSNW